VVRDSETNRPHMPVGHAVKHHGIERDPSACAPEAGTQCRAPFIRCHGGTDGINKFAGAIRGSGRVR